MILGQMNIPPPSPFLLHQRASKSRSASHNWGQILERVVQTTDRTEQMVAGLLNFLRVGYVVEPEKGWESNVGGGYRGK
jgi:hypothetical protein